MDKNRVFCNLCKGEKKKEAGISYCGGTTSLNNHMETHHPDLWYEYKKEAQKGNPENEGEKFRKYLCAPATSTQAERVFSAMAWLLNKRRLGLTGSHVNEQMVLKFNLAWD